MRKIANTLRLLPAAVIVTMTAVFAIYPDISAKKIKTRLKPETEDSDMQMVKGTFMVANDCETCNSGYSFSQFVYTGFDKPQSSATESFFLSNHTDCILEEAAIYIEYLTQDSIQLHKRFVKFQCHIPAGETRRVDIRTWDKQRSFYYEKSTPGRRGGTPFIIRITPIAYYLRPVD